MPRARRSNLSRQSRNARRIRNTANERTEEEQEIAREQRRDSMARLRASESRGTKFAGSAIFTALLHSLFEIMTPYELQKQKFEQQRNNREGMALLSKRRLEQLQQNIQEQRKLRDMLDKYYPWGKPGGGAPNTSIRLSNIRTSELIPDDEKRTRFGLCPKYVPSRSPRSYYQQPRKATIKEDPALRFQIGETVRPEIENKFRYRTSRQQQDFYRRQLDSIIAEQKKTRAKLEKEKVEYAKQMERFGTPWGKAGPGGFPWRPPPQIGSNFFKSMGWTTENILQEIEKNNFLSKSQKELQKLPKIVKTNQIMDKSKEAEKENNDECRKSTGELTGGIELVPLLAKRRAAAVRLPLSSTDVTRIPECPKSWTYDGPEYLEQLSTQVKQKHTKLLESQKNEQESNRLHFETWQTFWGRPGNGAPISDDHHKKRLDELLYYKPIKCTNH